MVNKHGHFGHAGPTAPVTIHGGTAAVEAVHRTCDGCPTRFIPVIAGWYVISGKRSGNSTVSLRTAANRIPRRAIARVHATNSRGKSPRQPALRGCHGLRSRGGFDG